MKIKIPKTTIFGKPVKGAMERALNKQDPVPEPETVAVSGNINPSEYLGIPGTNTIISKFELPDYNNLNWKDTHFKLYEKGLYMPTPAIFMPHFLNVIDAYKNKTRLFDAAGNPIPENELEDMYLHLTKDHIAAYQGGQTGAWTWLDAQFEEQGEAMKIHTNHKVVNNKLKPQTIQDLEQCIKKDCYVDLEFNSQGFPTRESSSQNYIQGQNIYFWHPRNGSVARFGAGSGRADLGCDWYPDYMNSSLGVFGCSDAGGDARQRK